MKNQATCPICGEGHLTKKNESDDIVYKGITKKVNETYYICSHCHVEQVGAKELKANKRAMNEFKKEVEGLLTGKEVLQIRNKLRLSQNEASLVFGGGPNAFTKYENDDVIQSESMDKLMRVAAELPSAFDLLCKQAHVKPKKVVEHEQMLTFSLSRGFENFSVKSASWDASRYLLVREV